MAPSRVLRSLLSIAAPGCCAHVSAGGRLVVACSDQNAAASLNARVVLNALLQALHHLQKERAGGKFRASV
jgi:hypothetical protein